MRARDSQECTKSTYIVTHTRTHQIKLAVMVQLMSLLNSFTYTYLWFSFIFRILDRIKHISSSSFIFRLLYVLMCVCRHCFKHFVFVYCCKIEIGVYWTEWTNAWNMCHHTIYTWNAGHWQLSVGAKSEHMWSINARHSFKWIDEDLVSYSKWHTMHYKYSNRFVLLHFSTLVVLNRMLFYCGAHIVIVYI